MTYEQTILVIIWAIGLLTILVVFKTFHSHFKQMILALLASRCLTWVNSIARADLDFIQFPVREFPKASDVLFTTEFFMYPLLYSLYYITKPLQKGMIHHFAYLCLWTSGLTLIDVLIEKNTDLIQYTHNSWYWTWMDFLIVILISNLYCNWFFSGTRSTKVRYES